MDAGGEQVVRKDFFGKITGFRERGNSQISSGFAEATPGQDSQLPTSKFAPSQIQNSHVNGDEVRHEKGDIQRTSL